MKTNKNEKGAALVTVILITLLLLVACIGLLLESSMNSYNVSDSLAEQQAYAAAESGIQHTLNLLRDKNLKTVPLADRLSYKKASNPKLSNKSGDSSTKATLSAWMNYNYQNSDGINILTMPDGGSYDPNNGVAYSVVIEDPDETSKTVSYRVDAIIDKRFVTEGSATANVKIDGITFDFNAVNNGLVNTVDVDSNTDIANLNIGSFVNTPDSPASALTQNVRFDIIVRVLSPYPITKVIRGWFPIGYKPNDPNLKKFYYKSKILEFIGSDFTIYSESNSALPIKEMNGTALVGYATTDPAVKGTIQSFEPLRLRVISTGYGPRGSKKVLEAIVRQNVLDSFPLPATLLPLGEWDEVPQGGNTNPLFSPGPSAAYTVVGVDKEKDGLTVPPIGTIDDNFLTKLLSRLEIDTKFNNNVIGTPDDVTYELPIQLSSPKFLDEYINEYRDLAIAKDRYFQGGSVPDYGVFDSSEGVTFIEGDHVIQGGQLGGGTLICTGNLTIKGNFSFNGTIYVAGKGELDVSGAGNGQILGSIVIAPYSKPVDETTKYGKPKYTVKGNGTSDLIYRSDATSNGLNSANHLSLGIFER